MNQRTKVNNLHRTLLRWYRAHGRSLPWRKARNPYHILVSEIMLQQTQVRRVQQKYPMFLKRFPTITSLANATPAAAIRAWQGMGYNNRALRLRDIAKTVLVRHRGKVPDDFETLTSLPGIGRYTAHAVACFAFHRHVPVVDVNVHRVLSRVLWRMHDASQRKDSATIWKLAARLLPGRNAFHWNQALMDLGATICTTRKPLCSVCPISAYCVSYPALSRTNGRPPSGSKPREKLYDGFPIRIYRGRIVEQLRHLNGKRGIELHVLGKLVKPHFSHRETEWLKSVLEKLEIDGLARLDRKKRTLFASLPQ